MRHAELRGESWSHNGLTRGGVETALVKLSDGLAKRAGDGEAEDYQGADWQPVVSRSAPGTDCAVQGPAEVYGSFPPGADGA